MVLNDTTNVPSSEVPENAGFTDIDVNDVNVTKDDINNAMNAVEAPAVEEEVVATPNEEVSQEATPEEVVNVQTPIAQAENAEDVVGVVQEETVVAPEPVTSEEPVSEVPVAQEEPTNVEVTTPEVPQQEISAEEVALQVNDVVTPTPYEVVPVSEERNEVISSIPEVPTPYTVVDTPEENVVEEEVQEEDIPTNFTEVKTDTIVEEPITIPAINYEKFSMNEEKEEKVEKFEDDNLLDEVNFDHKFETNSLGDLFNDFDTPAKEEKPVERKDSFDDFLSELTKKEETPLREERSYDVRNLDVRNNNYNDSYSYSAPKSGSSIMDSAVSTISRLIEVNKSQSSELDEYKHQVQELTDLNRKVVDRAKEDRDRIRTSIQNYEDQIERLKAQMDSLEDRVRDKERIIHSQTEELSELRNQVEGSNNLAKVLEDAQSILGNDRY
jgi:hypothetical protein